MCALRQSVDSGICSPGPENANEFAADTLECALNMILNRIAMGLTLPARELRSVVGDNQFQPSRHPNLLRRLCCMSRVLSPIEVSLQNHLSGYLIDIAASSARFLARVTQRSMRCNGGQALVPRRDRARKNLSQFFDEPEDLTCSSSNLAAHLPWDSNHDMVHVLLANYSRDSLCGLFVCRNCLQWMGKQL